MLEKRRFEVDPLEELDLIAFLLQSDPPKKKRNKWYDVILEEGEAIAHVFLVLPYREDNIEFRWSDPTTSQRVYRYETWQRIV